MTEHTDELRALRERAYGPAADIDPASLRRLHELEGLDRRETPASSPSGAAAPAADAPGGALDEPAASAARDAIAPGDETAPATEDVADEPHARAGDADAARPPRRMPLLWAGSLVVAAVLGAISATGIQSLVTGRVAVLGLDETSPWPQLFGSSRPEGGRMFDAFEGLDVLVVPQQFGDASDGTECLYVSGSAGSQVSVSTAGCAVAPFAAIASLRVTAASPESLRARFPDGTALEFRLDGSRVLVSSAPR